MYLDDYDKTKCCGCTACKQICPKNCIEMVKDNEGFLYAKKINLSKCIECNLCEKVCPLNNSENHSNVPKCYYGWHSNENQRMLSTSGAAFIALAEICKKYEYYFCGAVYSDDYKNVHHICSNSLNDIYKMRGSKYVQSNIQNCFLEIKELLNKGKKVLFCGTPCQAYGLKKYIGNELDKNLLIVGLVCHGVASPECYKKYIEEIELKYNSKIRSIKFRDKLPDNGVLSHKFTTIKMQNGEFNISTKNPYTLTYGMGLMHRPSCSSCPYTTPIRNIDLTIGDFWGIEDHFPKLKDEVSKGISLILVHTEKGQRIIDELHEVMVLNEVPYTFSLNARQHQLSRPIEENSNRTKFINTVLNENNSFDRTAKKYILKNQIIRKFDYIYIIKKNVTDFLNIKLRKKK